MRNDIVTSILLYGEINQESQTWERWYESSKKIMSSLGYDSNYASIDSDSKKSGEVTKIDNIEKKILKSINSGDSINWISIYSLPEDFKSAAFDYNMVITRSNTFVSLTINKDRYKSGDEDRLINILKEYIDFNEGEVFELNRDESPLGYILKANSVDFYETLKIVKKIEH